MALSSGIIAGIAAALAWGVADVFVKLIVDRVGGRRSLFWMALFGMIAVVPAALFLPVGVSGGAFSIFLLLLLGVLDAAGLFSFFRGLEVGKLSIVSPISGSIALVTVLLSFLFLGEALSQVQAAGVALVVGGIVLVSIDLKELRKSGKPLSAGVPYAVFTMLEWGAMWFFLAFAQAGATWLTTIIGLRISCLATVAAYSGVRKLDLKIGGNLLALAAAAGLLDTVAFLCLAYGYTMDLASVVGPIASTFPAVTVIIAIILLKERPALNQLIGIAAAIGGIIALSV